jgi:hypothetical protein
MPETYDIYRQWFRDHYGYEYPVSREEFRAWCRAPRRAIAENDFDIDTERREGWAYDNAV